MILSPQMAATLCNFFLLSAGEIITRARFATSKYDSVYESGSVHRFCGELLSTLD